jgi:hypothetical protein
MAWGDSFYVKASEQFEKFADELEAALTAAPAS